MRVNCMRRLAVGVYMHDEEILRYGGFIRKIAFGVLRNNEDAEECENDVYMKLYAADVPSNPSAYIGTVTKNTAINMLERKTAERRGGSDNLLDELSEVTADSGAGPERQVEGKLITECINQFLAKSARFNRMVFVRRYYGAESIDEIAKAFSISESKVKSILFRMRKELKKQLIKEDLL